MNTITIVLIVMAFDYGFGYMVKRHKNKKDASIRLEYISKIESILSDDTKPMNQRIYMCKDLSKHTEGDCAFGVYIALDTIEEELIN